MSTNEVKTKKQILLILRAAPNKRLAYATVFDRINYLDARAGNDKLWYFAIANDGVFDVAKDMAKHGLLKKTGLNVSNKFLMLTTKGLKAADKVIW